MATTPRETILTGRLAKAWRAMPGVEVLNVTGSMFQSSGYPDLHVCHPRIWSGWQEHKGNKTVISPAQKRILKTLGTKENAYLIRFMSVLGSDWIFEVSDSTLVSKVMFSLHGTDGQVASQLLHKLVQLDKVM